MEAHSLFELNEYIRRVIALNFREPLWIKAEANSVKLSRNNYYLDLVEKEKGKDNIIAQANGVLWARNYFFLKKKLGEVIDQILVDGTEILIKVKVDFSERYGLKLQIEDIDPAYTFGQTEIRRQQIIERVKKEELDIANKQFALPRVIQRVAVLSSSTAAGYQDFVNQLKKNSYDYDFQIKLIEIPVQGALLESKLIDALVNLNIASTDFDVICIVRGGGSRLDLSWFDTYPIAAQIASMDIPVLTGIGHDIDHSIADIVAHTYLKTPTAVADFILEHNLYFESKILEYSETIDSLVQLKISERVADIEKLDLYLYSAVDQKLVHESQSLKMLEMNVKMEYRSRFDLMTSQLEYLDDLIDTLDPKNVFQRGYAAVLKQGKSITSSTELVLNDEFIVKMKDGNVFSRKIK